MCALKCQMCTRHESQSWGFARAPFLGQMPSRRDATLFTDGERLGPADRLGSARFPQPLLVVAKASPDRRCGARLHGKMLNASYSATARQLQPGAVQAIGSTALRRPSKAVKFG